MRELTAQPTLAHVFTALAVARETQNRTGLAIRNVIRQPRSATIAVNGAVQVFPSAINPEQQKILDDLRKRARSQALRK